MNYTFSDYAEMHYYYGIAQGNGHLAARLYQQQLEGRGDPRQHYPDHRVFINTNITLMAGRVPGRPPHEGVPRVDPDRRDEVLAEIQRDPSTSSRRISNRTGIPRTSLLRILKSEEYHAYHIQRVQKLEEEDYPRRVAFCQTMLHKSAEDADFLNKILWTDESQFEKTEVFNMHNYHSWAVENPHLKRSSKFQVQFSVNMWSGIVDGQLIGPFELPARLNGAEYLNFLQDDLNRLLEDVNLEIRREMVFQNDSAPCHYSRVVRGHLDEPYPNRWIGRGGPIQWPPRSPDLKPIVFLSGDITKN